MFGRARDSTDFVSDIDSSTVSTTTSLWDSSVTDDTLEETLTDVPDADSEVSTEHSGSFSENEEDSVETPRNYDLRPRGKRSLPDSSAPPPSKRVCVSSTKPGVSRIGGSGGHNGGRGRGRGNSDRSLGKQGRGRGPKGKGVAGKSHTRGSTDESVPMSATPITVQHVQFTGPPAPFVPIRYPGPHLPQNSEAIVSALSLFELYFDDEVMGRILDCTLAYRRPEKRRRYNLFILVRLQDLLTCQRFELIGVFLHVVTLT